MSVSDVIQYILVRHYPFENLQEALSLRLVSKRMSKVITAKPRLDDVFWTRYFESLHTEYWFRMYVFLKVDLCTIALEGSSIINICNYYDTISTDSAYLTNNNYVLPRMNEGEITCPDQTTLFYNRSYALRGDHAHYCIETRDNIIACAYRGTLYRKCTHLLINGRNLCKDMGIRPSSRYMVILVYMSDAKKRGLIHPCSKEGELAYLRQHLHEIK